MKYKAYGEERTPTADGKQKFGTYVRDVGTGLDYADQRYYRSTVGRFLTPDPYMASGGPGDPGSWNRYAYVQGDPSNSNDPSGQVTCNQYQTSDTDYIVQCTTAYGNTYSRSLTTNIPNGSAFPWATIAQNTWGRQQEQADFQWIASTFTRAAILGLSENCHKELGADVGRMLGAVNRTLFLDWQREYVGQMSMEYLDDRERGTVREFMTGAHDGVRKLAFVSKNKSVVVVGWSDLFRSDAGAAMVHEMLHVVTGMGDVELANSLGIRHGNGTAFEAEEWDLASQAVNSYLRNDCDPKRVWKDF